MKGIDMDIIGLIPIPIALGMVLYVSTQLEKHEKNCPIHAQLLDINRKIDMILEHLLEKR